MQRPDSEPRLTPKLKPAFEENDVGRVWHAIEHARDNERKPYFVSRGLLAAGGFACAAALALLAFFVTRPTDAPLALRDARPLPTSLGEVTASTQYRLDDGSEILLSPGSSVEVLR